MCACTDAACCLLPRRGRSATVACGAGRRGVGACCGLVRSAWRPIAWHAQRAGLIELPCCALSRTMPHRRCPISPHEPVFARLTARILASAAMLGPGSIVDSGAHRGDESCLYASLQPDRIVHAVEPLEDNLRHLRRNYGASLPNVRPMLGALGGTDRTVHLRGPRTSTMLTDVDRRPAVSGNVSAGTVRVHSLDSLFLRGEWAGETLAFGHFDVEGSELDLLRGASTVLRRDRPIITVEVALARARVARAILVELESLAYRVWLVPECCGLNSDCRNLICLPVGRNASPALASVALPIDSGSFSSTALMRVPLVGLKSLGGADGPFGPGLEARRAAAGGSAGTGVVGQKRPRSGTSSASV